MDRTNKLDDAYNNFWQWFSNEEEIFFEIVKENERVDEYFLNKLLPKLQELNEDFYSVTGLVDNNTAELIITTDGNVKAFVFAEDFIAAAPILQRWRFAALKPPCDINTMGIEMEGYEFNEDNISFISKQQSDYPDEINIVLIHKDYTEENQETIVSGCFIFLDNMLGEYNTATMLDTVEINGPTFVKDEGDIIPIIKLKDYLVWREKEFVEKYDGVRYGTENDKYMGMEGHDENGLPVLAIINQDLVDWDAKASHPWMMAVEIKYKPDESDGMPTAEDSELMNTIEDNITATLIDKNGYLNLGRETYNGHRAIYFACKEFRHSSKVLYNIVDAYKNKIEMSYSIFKDKYWTTVNHLTKVEDQEDVEDE